MNIWKQIFFALFERFTFFLRKGLRIGLKNLRL